MKKQKKMPIAPIPTDIFYKRLFKDFDALMAGLEQGYFQEAYFFVGVARAAYEEALRQHFLKSSS